MSKTWRKVLWLLKPDRRSVRDPLFFAVVMKNETERTVQFRHPWPPRAPGSFRQA